MLAGVPAGGCGLWGEREKLWEEKKKKKKKKKERKYRGRERGVWVEKKNAEGGRKGRKGEEERERDTCSAMHVGFVHALLVDTPLKMPVEDTHG